MKKLYAILVLVFLMLGVSSVFAQDTPTNEIVAVANVDSTRALTTAVSPTVRTVSSESPTITAVSTTTSQKMCVVNAELMRELDRLVKMLNEAVEKDDKETVKRIEEKIQTIKEAIRKDTEECEKKKLKLAVPVESVSIKEEGSETTVSTTTVRSVDRCAELKEWEQKLEYYRKLYSLSDEELKEKGYNSKEEIKRILEELKQGIERLKKECESKVAIAVSTQEIAIIKPVVAETGEEITEYYKLKISKIIEKEANTGEQIKDLKELRLEIDRLIEELIKSKDEINTEEINDLVEEVKVKPREIKADDVVVSTTGKHVIAKINEKELRIKPMETNVIVQDDELEIKAPELSIKENVVKIGNSEVKIAASDVVEKIKVEPKEIELKEENNKAVYKIKTEEKRKILGFIPAKAEKTLTVDASDTNAEIIEEEKPWWDFLSVKAENE